MTNENNYFDYELTTNTNNYGEISLDEVKELINGEPIVKNVWVHFFNTGEEKCFIVKIKNCLSSEEIIEFYNYVASYIASGFVIDDEEDDNKETIGYEPYTVAFIFNTALIYYYVVDETFKNMTIAELWKLIGNTNIIQCIRNCASVIQINELEKALNKYEKMVIKSIFENNVSDEMVSALAGVVLQLSEGVEKVNDIINSFETTIMKDGKFNTKELSKLVKLFKDIDGIDTLKKLFGSLSLEKGEDKDGASKED